MPETHWTITARGRTENDEPWMRGTAEIQGWTVELYVEPDRNSYVDGESGYWKYTARRDTQKQGGHGYGARSFKQAARRAERGMRYVGEGASVGRPRPAG